MVLKECNTLGKKNGFKTLELLHAVILTSEEWTSENGLVTAAQKIQRSKIAKTFGAEINVCVCSVFRVLSHPLTHGCRLHMRISSRTASSSGHFTS
jgi:hypothetical protein